jgi:hypothetical protein
MLVEQDHTSDTLEHLMVVVGLQVLTGAALK